MPSNLFRKSGLDIYPLLVSLICGCVLALFGHDFFPVGILADSLKMAVVAAMIWYISNTVSHIHLHTRLFEHNGLNTIFSFYLTLLTSIPQSLWRTRHMQHHAPQSKSKPNSNILCLAFFCELLGILALWSLLGAYSASFFYPAFLPGFLLGLCFCRIQGHFEHTLNGVAIPQGASYYASFYNLIFFNDGYHVEHHLRPNIHWTRHKPPNFRTLENKGNQLPPILGWLGTLSRAINRIQAGLLIQLENQIFGFPKIQKLIIASHRNAIAELMLQCHVPVPSRICVIGGGGFPRSVLLMRQLYPDAIVTVVDQSLGNLNLAKRFLEKQNIPMERIHLCNGIPDSTHLALFDLVLIPLGFRGDKNPLLPAAGSVSKTVFLVHDWIWRSKARGIRVSWWLLKRINLFSARIIA